ncbi:hypothetical protein DYB26_010931, partial [Aphanomyces astaci]
TYQPQSAKRVCMFVFYQVTTVVIMILFSTPTAVLIYVKLDTHSAVYAIFTHDISSILAKFITSYLPSLLLITVNWCLLTSLFYLTTVEPWLSESERMKSFLNKGFSYLLLSSIVLPSIGVTAVYLATDQGASLHHGSEAAYIERFMFQLCRNFFIAYVCQRYILYFSQVEVDILTGEVNVLRTDIMYDCGKSFNPVIDIGQIEGAFVMALGLFFQESVEYDAAGRLLTSGTWEYKVPSHKDIPEVLNVTLLDKSDNPRGVMSSKAVGEPPFQLVNSVYFALKYALRHSRLERNVTEFFQLDMPATVDRRLLAAKVQPAELQL